MAWWQKKLLHYALARTGLLDDKAIDPKNLDITLGRANVVELKDVGLNIQRLSKLAQLPPGLRLETARVLSLRLTVPADIYHASIVAEVDGLELVVRLEGAAHEGGLETGSQPVSPATMRSPQHRKAHRRRQSPLPYNHHHLSHSEQDRIPSTHEMAESFLLAEPTQHRRDMEASVAAEDKTAEEPISSESSDGNDVGTGAGIGLPGFLASFLQGIVDRLVLRVKNVEVRMETEIVGETQEMVPVTLRLQVGTVELEQLGAGAVANIQLGKRCVKVRDLHVDLLSDATAFSELSDLPSRTSPANSKRPSRSAPPSDAALPVATIPTTTDISNVGLNSSPVGSVPSYLQHNQLQASVTTLDEDRFADAGEDAGHHVALPTMHEHDIKVGDDNLSWASRRSQTDSRVEDSCSSSTSEDDLPESLLLEQAPPRKASFSPKVSPVARSRRAVSPYSRSLQSPASRSRSNESLEGRRMQYSPSSRLTLDRTRQSVLQSRSHSQAQEENDLMDNKRTALEVSVFNPDALAMQESSIKTSEPAGSEIDDMMQSRMYTHEEAESMYMSAMTHGSTTRVPGGWGSGSAASTSSKEHDSVRPPMSSVRPEVANQDFDTQSDRATPRPLSPNFGKDTQTQRDLSTKRLVSVNLVSLWLPANTDEEKNRDDTTAPGYRHPTTHERQDTAARRMPGTFSTDSDHASSRQQDEGSVAETDSDILRSSPHPKPTADTGDGYEIDFEEACATIDISSCRLLHAITNAGIRSLYPSRGRMTKIAPGLSDELVTKSVPSVTITARSLELSLVEHVQSQHSGGSKIGLITVALENVMCTKSPTDMDLRVGRIRALLGESELLAFDRPTKASPSAALTERPPDVALVVNTAKSTAHKRPITEVVAETLGMTVQLDLSVIDDTLSSFGGLSGFLDLSNSLLLEGSPLSVPVSAEKPSKGVRFQGDPEPVVTGPELKFNGRIRGIDITLRGETCAINVCTTTVKAIYREHGAVTSIEEVVLTSPQQSHGTNLPVSVDIANLRVDYLFTPQDKDLERVLSLLTPTRDKYDNDDDILIDTLLRQRKKGAVARVVVGNVRVNVADLGCIETATMLSAELNKFSAVTKYLPEDERPGLLTLVRIKEFEARLPVNDQFGTLQVVCRDFHCAHVGLPALLALSIGGIKADRLGHEDLLHPLHPLSDGLPMLMARMLGDEAEPTVKVKLYNVCLEYSVPIVLALTDMRDGTEAEELLMELAKSIANLPLRQSNSGKGESHPADRTAQTSGKKTNIVVLVHDSAIGLNPERAPSRCLVVLTDARVSTLLPPEGTLAIDVELRKAALFITDNTQSAQENVATFAHGFHNPTTTSDRLAATLFKQGFVSVGSIMAATIAMRLEDDAESSSKSVILTVKNELLLLETCADSTQTLIAILSGLAPPTPPSKQPKYLTEPMTLEDLMASFTGEPEGKLGTLPETLFDVEEEPDDGLDAFLGETMARENSDDLLLESEMTSSLYGPVSGVLDNHNRIDEDQSDMPDVSHTVESLLEEDPFEMPFVHNDETMSDSALMRDLITQRQPTLNRDAIDLGIYESDNLGFDAMGTGQQAFDSSHRFGGPETESRRPAYAAAQRTMPFKLHLRDTHILWNMHDGYDWQHTRDSITEAVEQVEARADERNARRRRPLQDHEEEEPVIADVLFNSIYIGVAANHDAQELRRQINRGIDDLASETESVPLSGMSRPTAYSASGRPIKNKQRRRLKLERSKTHKVALELKGVFADVLVFPPDAGDVVSQVDVRIRDFEIYDNLPTSTWRKFLTTSDNDPRTREMSKPMVHMELSNVRTLQDFAASEIVIHAALTPLRLHVDQDALDFIVRFFEFKDASITDSGSVSEQPFIQRIEIETVDLKLDYKPKRVDYGGIRSGHTSEFMNFVTLDAANIKLKHAIVYGLRGFAPLHQTLNDIWLPDVTRNQLPTVLSGLAPVRSLVNIGTGVRDVVAIPIREYKKDGRIVRSIQRGALRFGRTTTSELARLGAKLAIGTQNLLQDTEGFLSPSSDSPSGRPGIGRRVSSDQGWHDMAEEGEAHEERLISAYANQPPGLFAGLSTARRQLEHDLLTAKDALIAVQGEVLESRSPGAAAAAVARRAPTVILRPIIGASRAVGTAMLGVGNQIDRGNLRRIEDKYKRR